MHRFTALARSGPNRPLSHNFQIWEPGRFGARRMGATMTVRAARNRPGFERAAEDPLGARE